jgi:hypothetical protein
LPEINHFFGVWRNSGVKILEGGAKNQALEASFQTDFCPSWKNFPLQAVDFQCTKNN